MSAPAKFKWSEVLAARGEPVSAIESAVFDAEKRLQAQQAAYNKAKDAKAVHDPERHGLSPGKVASLVRPRLSGAAWVFCGKEYVAELFEAL
jgi:hypothetical protein